MLGYGGGCLVVLLFRIIGQEMNTSRERGTSVLQVMEAWSEETDELHVESLRLGRVQGHRDNGGPRRGSASREGVNNND